MKHTINFIFSALIKEYYKDWIFIKKILERRKSRKTARNIAEKFFQRFFERIKDL
jgi:hypothetical protein